jgi:Na+/proline symporter
VTPLDYVVLLGTMLGIALYGIWKTRGRRNLQEYVKGGRKTPWFVIGLSVMATQASATTFLSTPGQGYASGLGFVQNYFGAPFALIIIAAFFLPIYRKLNVYTAYEYLGQRFDKKTRLLGAGLFLLQRGIGAGITLYAPAIVLSTVMGWRLDVTIVASGLLVIAYTVAGGSEAVNVTQKYQLAVIFAGMATAMGVLVAKLPAGLTVTDAMTVAGGFGKLDAVNFSPSLQPRYTFWSGTIGGLFLALCYFGTDQSQVQRYIGGTGEGALREGRLGLMFNAVCKIPMQFLILMLGVLLFTFYQFERPPVYFQEVAWRANVARGGPVAEQLQSLETQYNAAHAAGRAAVDEWLRARHAGDAAGEATARDAARAANASAGALRAKARDTLVAADPSAKANENDYVFITFILHHLPHGVIGLLVATFFAAAFSSKAGELNALGATSTVDVYRYLLNPGATDAHYVFASKCFTVFWGLVAIAFSLFAHMTENLIQATNIVGSIFYGVMVGLFLVGFFIRWVRGTAVFLASVVGQLLVFALYAVLPISYLWFNLIGCVLCVGLALMFQAILSVVEDAPAAVAVEARES